MPLNPPPTIDSGLLLVRQQILRGDMTRAAEVEYALVCADAALATFQDAIDDFQANFNTNMAPVIDAGATVLPPTGRGGDGTNVPILVTAAGAAVAGGGSSTVNPPNVALLIRKRTPLGGRKNRGRTYLPFALVESAVSENGTISPTQVTALQAQATLFLNQLSTDITPMVIENKTFNTPLPPHFVTAINPSVQNVSAYTVENLVATQRRRLGR